MTNKNRWAVVYAITNGVLALLTQQIAAGQYPISEPAKSVVLGILALVITAATLSSPWFDPRAMVKK
jgi:hypothetical protein